MGMTRISEIFGVPELPHELFYAFPYSLRLELGGEEYGMDDPIPRFLQALHRARSVAEVLFKESSQVSTLIASYAPEEPGVQGRQALRDLHGAGFDTSRLTLIGRTPLNDADHIAEFGGASYRYWHAGDLEPARRDVDKLLWCSIAAEMPISPRAGRLDIYLMDWARRLILHAYDDRGMDVISMNRDLLQPLHQKFDAWLLDHDRPRMARAFAL